MSKPQADCKALATAEEEKTILTAILYGAVYREIAEVLTEEDFSVEAYRSVFARMKEVADAQQNINVESLIAAFDRHKDRGVLGGREIVESLKGEIVSDSVLQENVGIVGEKSTLHRIVAICKSTIERACNQNTSAAEVARQAEQQLFEACNCNSTGSLQRLDAIVSNSFGSADNLYKVGYGVTGLATGFAALDQLTGGLKKGHLTVIAAFPGMGKAAFAMNIAQNALLRKDATVAFFCGEICKEELVLRMLVSEAWVDQRKLQTGFLCRDDYQKLQKALGRLVGSQMYLDDAIGISLAEIRAIVLRLKRRVSALDLIVINGLEMLSGVYRPSGKETDDKAQSTYAIVHGLKALAKDLDVPVVVLSELSSRNERSTSDNRPRLSDLSAASSIAKEADAVLFIHRESYFYPEKEMSEAERARTEIIVTRNRSGPSATVYLNFISRFGRFENPDV